MRLLVFLISIFSGSAIAQFPSHPITMVVGFAPGGGTDITARILARKLSDSFGQQVVVENRPGAGGNISVELVAKAAPDGHYIGLANVGSLTVAPYIVSKLAYDTRRDLAPVTMAVVFPNVLVVHPSLGVKTFPDFIKLAKSKPGSISYGSSGIGGTGHLAGELLRTVAGIDIVHVPYKGGGPAAADLLGGQVGAVFATVASSITHVKAGKIYALAVTGAKRSQALPDVPTIAESGYPGYEATNWYAYMLPAKTPREIVERWNLELRKALDAPDVHQQLAVHGLDPAPSTPEELARYIDKELETWGRVVKQAGIKAD